MTISQIEQRLESVFPGLTVKVQIEAWIGGPKSSIAAFVVPKDGPCIHVEDCRSIEHAIESLREKMKPVTVGHVEIEA